MEDGFLNKWKAIIPVGSVTLEIIGVCFIQINDAGKIRRNEVYFDRAQLLAKSPGRKNLRQQRSKGTARCEPSGGAQKPALYAARHPPFTSLWFLVQRLSQPKKPEASTETTSASEFSFETVP